MIRVTAKQRELSPERADLWTLYITAFERLRKLEDRIAVIQAELAFDRLAVSTASDES